MDDALEDVLQKFHFAATSYCAYCTNRAPWGIQLGASSAAHFHAVRTGTCWVKVGQQAIFLEAGDFVVLPHGDAHAVSDAADSRAVPAEELLSSVNRNTAWHVNLGKEGVISEIICAGFIYTQGVHDPLLNLLPPMIHLRGSETASLEPLLVLAEQEMQVSGRGAAAMLARIGEMLLVESVRTFVAVPSRGEVGWLAALKDEKLARVIHAIHIDPRRRWLLSELAAEAGMSRTTLATRFSAVMGVSVQKYITRARLILAASLLESADRPNLTEIADAVGYSSDATFSRAFRRELGVPPSKLVRSSSQP